MRQLMNQECFDPLIEPGYKSLMRATFLQGTKVHWAPNKDISIWDDWPRHLSWISFKGSSLKEASRQDRKWALSRFELLLSSQIIHQTNCTHVDVSIKCDLLSQAMPTAVSYWNKMPRILIICQLSCSLWKCTRDATPFVLKPNAAFSNNLSLYALSFTILMHECWSYLVGNHSAYSLNLPYAESMV